MGYTNDFFNGFIKWGVLLPDLRFFGYTGMEKSTGRDVDLYFLGGPGILAEVISLRVNEVSSGDADVFTKGIYYTGNPQLISNMPSGLISNPTVIIYIGKSGGSDRGIQICINANRASGAKMAARALLYSGWTAWEEVNKT